MGAAASTTSFHPGRKTIIFATLFALLSTKSGRNLGAQIIHKDIIQRILFWLPLRVRCNVVRRILCMPIPKGRKIMGSATKPWGAQKDYITKIVKPSWCGHWIVHGSNSYKKTKRVQWVEETSVEADLVIYYIHGGGFKYGDSLMYMESFTHIIEHLRKTRGIDARIFSTEYGLAPEVNYFRSKEDCVNGYRYLVNDLQLNPKKIVFAGDSAGGNLVASSLMAIRDTTDLPQPAGNVQISPWITIDNSQSVRTNIVYQDCLTFDMLLGQRHDGSYFLPDPAQYANAEERRLALRNPLISPLYGSFVGFCPTLVTYGGTEIFQHDAEELIKNLKRDKVPVDVITRRHAPHIWIISSILSPTHDLWKKDCALLADWCANCVKNALA